MTFKKSKFKRKKCKQCGIWYQAYSYAGQYKSSRNADKVRPCNCYTCSKRCAREWNRRKR
ncbi:MAG: hypothetical protein AABY22_23560 [Nanoarchaeota archaeon]